MTDDDRPPIFEEDLTPRALAITVVLAALMWATAIAVVCWLGVAR